MIGSGAGGAVAAAVLAEAGLDVIVLEAGPYLDRMRDPDDPLTAIESLYRDNGLTVAEGRPMIPVPIGRAVGGTTVINSGTCFRAPEHVLASWATEHGIDWARRLDPEYAEAEEMLQVTPVDVERMGRNGQLVMEGAAAIGASGGPIPRNAGRCVGCSSCPLGCRLDAKRAMHVSYMPRAVAAGARVRAGVEARRLHRDNGRVTGVRSWSPGPPFPAAPGPRRTGSGPSSTCGAARSSSPAVRSAPRSCCCATAYPASRSGVTSTSTQPPGSAASSTRRCAAGTG